MEFLFLAFLVGVIIWVIAASRSDSRSSSRGSPSGRTSPSQSTSKGKRHNGTRSSKITPLRAPTFDELKENLATVPSSDDILAHSLKAFGRWFEEQDIAFLGSSDGRVHIAPQFFYFKQENAVLVGRKWAFADPTLDSASSLAQEAHDFGRRAAEEERPQVFLLVFEDRGPPRSRRMAFQVVARNGENTLRFRTIVERDGSAHLSESYALESDDDNVALDVAKSFWLGAGVDPGISAPDHVTVGRSPGKDKGEGEADEESSANVTFRVSTSYGRTVSDEELLAQSRSAWTPAGSEIAVNGWTISGGMVYVGTELAPADGYQASDPALINPDLKVSRDRADRKGQHLDYWPSYSDIPPTSRCAFLDWLAMGRREEGYAIGYVFLFFYGLERRILFDAQHDSDAEAEIPTLIDELEALKATYGPTNRSFYGYCDRLLTYTRRAYGYEETVSSPTYQSSADSYRMSRGEKVALGRIIASRDPISAEWALAWVRSDPEVRLRTPGRRCREEFDTLFCRRYSDQFEDGLVVEASATTLTVSYRPASGGIRNTFAERIDDAVDIGRMSIPPELRDYASSIEDDLDDYSRWIGRRDERSSLAALGQLPSELTRDRAGEDARQFVEQIESWMDENGYAVIRSEELLARWPSKNEDYLTKTEAEALSGFLAGFDLGVEPDVRYTRNPSKRDYLTIFRLQGPDEPPGETFRSARLLLHLAAAVAGADEEIAPGEEEHIERHLERSLDLTVNEQARLRAHLACLLDHPPTLRGVRRRAEELSDDQRRRLATFLLTVAGADGHLASDEITVLEKIYDILGLGENQVHQDLHNLSARDPGSMDRGPVIVIEADDQKTYRVPDKDESRSKEEQKPSTEEAFDLDLDRVAAVQDETRDVARVLDDVFSEEDEEEIPSFSLDGLSEDHEALLAYLGTKSEWSRADFDKLAEKHGLMPGFAIEQINDRAFEVADEPVLEGEDPIELNPYALDALQS